jgi:hypothetical protein
VELLSFLGEDALRMATEYRPFQQWIVARPRMQAAAAANEVINVSAGVR